MSPDKVLLALERIYIIYNALITTGQSMHQSSQNMKRHFRRSRTYVDVNTREQKFIRTRCIKIHLYAKIYACIFIEKHNR